MQTTITDLRRLTGILEELVQPLLEGEEIESHFEAHRKPHLVLQEGSKTYGRAFRIHFTGGSKYGSGHYEPRGFSGYLGDTKSEAERTLKGLITGIRTGLMIQQQANSLLKTGN
jgi:hypothetical protein